MKIITKIYCVLILFITLQTAAFSMENIVYFLRSKSPSMQGVVNSELKSLESNYRSINLIITQAYQISAKGDVTGYVNQEMMGFAKRHNIKVMILVTNTGFDKKSAHLFLANQKAQIKAIQSIINLCKKSNFHGVQFDFENVDVADKRKLTSFYLAATSALHKKAYRVSYAIVPLASNNTQHSAYLKRKYNNWGGVYDLKALGQAADFITIMSYDQHMDGTTPGPNAGIRWVNATIKHALQYIPANKLSLGIPTYSKYWHLSGNSSGKISVKATDISYPEVKSLLTRNHAATLWDKADKINYAMFERAWVREFIFIEDGASFKAKLALAKGYKLAGISVFRLGEEDALIWKAIS